MINIKIEYKYRIDKITLWFMLSVALFFDLTQICLDIIPIVGWILSSLLSIFAFLTFYVWFKIRDIGFLTKFGVKKLLVVIVIPLLELFISFIPGLVVMVLLTYSVVKLEDEADRKKIMSRETQRKIGGMLRKNLT
jgi:hypothetical protein